MASENGNGNGKSVTKTWLIGSMFAIIMAMGTAGFGLVWSQSSSAADKAIQVGRASDTKTADLEKKVAVLEANYQNLERLIKEGFARNDAAHEKIEQAVGKVK